MFRAADGPLNEPFNSSSVTNSNTTTEKVTFLGGAGTTKANPISLLFLLIARQSHALIAISIMTPTVTGFRLRIENDRLQGHEGPFSVSRLDFGSVSDLRRTEELIKTLAVPLGLMSDWVRNGELSAEIDTRHGDTSTYQPARFPSPPGLALSRFQSL